MTNANNLSKMIIAMGQRGESAYGVNGEEIHDIPAQACRGRAGITGKTFSGFINLHTGKIRFDCAEAPEFWLEVDLNKTPFFAAAPGGATAMMAASDFESRRDELQQSKWSRTAFVRDVKTVLEGCAPGRRISAEALRLLHLACEHYVYDARAGNLRQPR